MTFLCLIQKSLSEMTNLLKLRMLLATAIIMTCLATSDPLRWMILPAIVTQMVIFVETEKNQ